MSAWTFLGPFQGHYKNHFHWAKHSGCPRGRCWTFSKYAKKFIYTLPESQLQKKCRLSIEMTFFLLKESTKLSIIDWICPKAPNFWRSIRMSAKTFLGLFQGQYKNHFHFAKHSGCPRRRCWTFSKYDKKFIFFRKKLKDVPWDVYVFFKTLKTLPTSANRKWLLRRNNFLT